MKDEVWLIQTFGGGVTCAFMHLFFKFGPLKYYLPHPQETEITT